MGISGVSLCVSVMCNASVHVCDGDVCICPEHSIVLVL